MASQETPCEKAKLLRKSKYFTSESIHTSKPILIKKLKSFEQCAICFDDIQVQGMLKECSHTFCFVCIMKWSDVTNTCPLCKLRFNNIHKKIPGSKTRLPTIEIVTIKDKIQRVHDSEFDNFSEEVEWTEDILFRAHGYDISDGFVVPDNHDELEGQECYSDNSIDEEVEYIQVSNAKRKRRRALERLKRRRRLNESSDDSSDED